MRVPKRYEFGTFLEQVLCFLSSWLVLCSRGSELDLYIFSLKISMIETDLKRLGYFSLRHGRTNSKLKMLQLLHLEKFIRLQLQKLLFAGW